MYVDRHSYRKTDRQTDMYVDRHSYRKTDGWMDRQTEQQLV